MRYKQKKFIPGCPTHIYQKGYNGNVLFYCVRDRLVYLSIFFDEARKRGIIVLAIALMFNHVHGTIKVGTKRALTNFNQTVQRRYATLFNRVSGGKGPVFLSTYGWSQKRSDEDVRNNLCYLANNSRKKKLYKRGIDDRWTLLAYAQKRFPFSAPLSLRKASRRMRRAVAMVKARVARGYIMTYSFLNQVFAELDHRECNQLVDVIIQEICRIDYWAAASYFGDFDKMLAAFDITSGSEYEISEEFTVEPDIPYRDMSNIARRAGYDLVEKRFLSARDEAIVELVRAFSEQTSASPRQINRFLHLPKPES